MELKQCSICKLFFEATNEYFYNNKNKIDGLFPYCKECCKQKSINWIKNNKEKRSIIESKCNKRRKSVIDKYRKADRENGKYRKWQQNNKDKIKEYRKLHKNHNITKEEWIFCKEYFNNSCAYCGISEEKHRELYNQDLHKEHINSKGSNDLSNCIPSCKSCNSSKGILELNNWYNKENFVYKDERYNKIIQWLEEKFE